jgi:hypothetical protein
MRALASVFLVGLVAATTAGATATDRPSARLSASPPALERGAVWNARFVLRRGGKPLAGARPGFWIRGAASRSFRSRELGGGRYGARVVFPVVGRYRFGVRVGDFSLRLGALTVQGAAIRAPLGLAVDPDGALYVADVQGSTVVQIDPRTRRRSVAARGLRHPVALAFDGSGRLLVSDETERVFRFEPGTTRTLVAGTGTRAHTGDGGPATAASLAGAGGMDVDGDGNLILAEYDGWIRIVRPSGTIGSLAGNGTEGYSGDGGPASRAVLRHPHDVAVLTSGALAIADSHNAAVRRIDLDGTIRTIARQLGAPVGIAPAPNDGVYVADGNGRILLVRAGGATSTVATGATPFGIASGGDSVYFSELETRRVKRVDPATGKVTTLVP